MVLSKTNSRARRRREHEHFPYQRVHIDVEHLVFR